MENSQPLPTPPASSPSPEIPPRDLAHWCHQCNIEVLAEPASTGADGDLICPDCGGGFIEAMDTATALASVRRAIRRNNQRRQHPSRNAATGTQQFAVEDGPDDASHRQVLRLLRFLARTSRNSPVQVSSRSSDVQTSNRSLDSGDRSNDSGFPFPSSVSSAPEHEQEMSGTEDSSGIETNAIVSGTDEVGQSNDDSSRLFAGDGLLTLEDDVEEDDEDSDLEAEAGLLELSDWDSLDEEEENEDDDDDEEWEEVEYDEADLVVRFLEAVDDGQEGGSETALETDRVTSMEEGTNEAAGLPGLMQSENNRSRARNFLRRTLQRRLQVIRRDLENYDSEFHMEGSEVDNHVGNPGDYVDAQGFEELLQQLIDTDNSRRGAPPAAKSAVECLPSILIQQLNLEDGSALCAICKEVVALGEPAKQLPCLHLYHSVCILPWLNSRNSCPVCRYELPTDDPDYEEQKRRNCSRRNAATGSNSESSSVPNSTIEAEGGSPATEGNLSDDLSSTIPVESTSESIQLESGISCSSSGTYIDKFHVKNAVLERLTGPLLNVMRLIAVSYPGNIMFGISSGKWPRLLADGQLGILNQVHVNSCWWMQLFS